VSCALHAQDEAASWGNLNTLREGEKIRVRETNKTNVAGRFVNFSETAITVQTQSGEQAIQRQDIRTVKRMKVKHRWLNSFILAGAGAAIGFGIGRSQYRPCTREQSFCFDFGDYPGSIGLVAGFLGGAATGALLPVHETVYSVSGH
jgi:hypothetical protein